jgi:hypothetical protein
VQSQGFLDKSIYNRVNVSSEIFSLCLSKSVSILKNEFQHNSSSVWIDSDKTRSLELAKILFNSAISSNFIEEAANKIVIPEIDDIELIKDEEAGKTEHLIDFIGSF